MNGSGGMLLPVGAGAGTRGGAEATAGERVVTGPEGAEALRGLRFGTEAGRLAGPLVAWREFPF